MRRLLACVLAALCAGARLKVDTVDGTVRDSGTGEVFVASGVNFGTRMTPKRDPWRTPPPPCVDRSTVVQVTRGVRAVCVYQRW